MLLCYTWTWHKLFDFVFWKNYRQKNNTNYNFAWHAKEKILIIQRDQASHFIHLAII